MSLKSRVTTDYQLMRWILLSLVLELILDTLWVLINSPTASLIFTEDDSGQWSVSRQCVWDGSPFLEVLALLKAAGMGWAVAVSFHSRDVPDMFNESRSLWMVIFNTSLTATTAFILSDIFRSDDNIDAQFWCETCSLTWVALFNCSVTILPRIICPRKPPARQSRGSIMGRTSLPKTKSIPKYDWTSVHSKASKDEILAKPEEDGLDSKAFRDEMKAKQEEDGADFQSPHSIPESETAQSIPPALSAGEDVSNSRARSTVLLPVTEPPVVSVDSTELAPLDL